MSVEVDLDDYDFPLPPERIAQHPPAERDASRLMHLDRASGERRILPMRELPALLAPGDLLVRNVTQVVPARLRGAKESGGAAEALLLEAEPAAPGRYRALVKARGRLRAGLKLTFRRGDRALDAEIAALEEDGVVRLAFPPDAEPLALGEAPLPPYIRRQRAEPVDESRYQTVYARVPGSVAAPTAGLHFTPALLTALTTRGVEIADLVLHVGPGTFRPLRDADLSAGRLHAERYHLPEATAEAVARTRRAGGRVLAVGTTSARVLESCADPSGALRPGQGETTLFLRPGGDRFRVVDALLTNFHLPRSSLLLLVAAFAGREPVLEAYAEAVARELRFYSYGDAMLLT